MENIIKIKNLNKTYITKNGSLTALDNINLDIQKGEIFGIIGLSGAGKSTLVRCINYLEQPTEGEVVFNGMTLGSLSAKKLREARQSIGMIFQNFNLLEQRTTLKNICFPLEIAGAPKHDAVKRARELLKLVGLADKENRILYIGIAVVLAVVVLAMGAFLKKRYVQPEESENEHEA